MRKLKLTSEQYAYAWRQWGILLKDYPKLRFGQYLVDAYGESDQNYPDLFHTDSIDVSEFIELS